MLNRNLPLVLLLGFLLPTAPAQQAATGTPSATPAPTQLPTQSPSPSQPPAPAPSTTTPSKPQTPEEFFARARQLSDLEVAGIPFHLKATYIASGNTEFTGNGTYEEWWISRDKWRKETSLGNFKFIVLHHGHKFDAYASAAYIPLQVRRVMSSTLIWISSSFGKSQDWQLKHKNLNGVDLALLTGKYNCVYPYIPPSQIKVTPWTAWCPISDFFTSDGLLRIQQEGLLDTIYNGWKAFQNSLVARNIIIGLGSEQILKISIDTLEPLAPIADAPTKIMALPSNMQSLVRSTPPTYILGEDLKGRALYAPAPEYPQLAKQQHSEGTVVISASIDDQGKIREPFVIRSSGSLLIDGAAMDTVRNWRYQPITVNGHPAVVQTAISVVFTLNR